MIVFATSANPLVHVMLAHAEQALYTLDASEHAQCLRRLHAVLKWRRMLRREYHSTRNGRDYPSHQQ